MSRLLVRSPPAARRLSPLGPGGRPFARWRPFAALLAAGAFLASTVLLLSDRAPGLLRRLSARIDAGASRTAQIASEARPQSDFEIHVLVWAVVTVFVGLAVWSSRSLLVSAIAVLSLSVAGEKAQELLTDTRHLEIGDLVANVVGVSAGVGVVSGLAILLGWKDEPRRRHIAGPGSGETP
ncbi:MAG TPA: hypothetical protein VHF24_06180 [Acidimicrobiales bacterium]|nr:hypothetical protein [Acidimicrobiales bacterium]